MLLEDVKKAIKKIKKGDKAKVTFHNGNVVICPTKLNTNKVGIWIDLDIVVDPLLREISNIEPVE